MSNDSVGLLGSNLSMDPSGGLLTPSAPTAVDVAMANRKTAALRGRRADERDEAKRQQQAKARKGVVSRVRKAPRALSLVTREHVLQLLSDEEIARVCTAEATGQLSAEEQYIDLAHLELGVRSGGTIPMARVLPRESIDPATWTKIVSQLLHPAS